jgi:hypothetical protein
LSSIEPCLIAKNDGKELEVFEVDGNPAFID